MYLFSLALESSAFVSLVDPTVNAEDTDFVDTQDAHDQSDELARVSAFNSKPSTQYSTPPEFLQAAELEEEDTSATPGDVAMMSSSQIGGLGLSESS